MPCCSTYQLAGPAVGHQQFIGVKAESSPVIATVRPSFPVQKGKGPKTKEKGQSMWPAFALSFFLSVLSKVRQANVPPPPMPARSIGQQMHRLQKKITARMSSKCKNYGEPGLVFHPSILM
ncbi:hypothetical protein BDA96_10G013000 [Sorghum bicolor]|uniref:Uncharacterized protein n=2 Tax=Sorghum bicolor TaxID=4558 RepID=A0A921Q0Y8_SORBI|nr:hypothetical protein BDA96_10G013000 [Sorghum bicolor]OQU75718.1 hypothetical protein SORBI_3010G011001 [Sorghum bicolor]